MLEKLIAFNNLYWDTPWKLQSSPLNTQWSVSHANDVVAPPFLFAIYTCNIPLSHITLVLLLFLCYPNNAMNILCYPNNNSYHIHTHNHKTITTKKHNFFFENHSQFSANPLPIPMLFARSILLVYVSCVQFF